MTPIRRLVASFLLLGLAACESTQLTKGTAANACLLTEPLWVKPPEDAAVSDPPTTAIIL